MNKELRIINKAIKTKRKSLIVAFYILYSIFFVSSAIAITNIVQDSPPPPDQCSECTQWAWNDYLGWIDLHSSGNVNVTDTKLTGFAVLENGDEISFDCATSPTGNICSTRGNYVVKNDGGGNLEGWAWNDTIGWISFCGGRGSDTDCPNSVNYQVSIDPDSKEFEGWAWNDIVGWISFNCSNHGDCGTKNYKVKTSWIAPLPVEGWLISNTFDTGFAEGVGYNSIMWLGEAPTSTSVKFQFATSNCENGADDPNNEDESGIACDRNVGWGDTKTSGDGAFVGEDGTSAFFYGPSLPGVPTLIYTHHANKRYYRYKVFLDKGQGTLESPIVEDVIVNWSR